MLVEAQDTRFLQSYSKENENPNNKYFNKTICGCPDKDTCD